MKRTIKSKKNRQVNYRHLKLNLLAILRSRSLPDSTNKLLHNICYCKWPFKPFLLPESLHDINQEQPQNNVKLQDSLIVSLKRTFKIIMENVTTPMTNSTDLYERFWWLTPMDDRPNKERHSSA